MKLKEKQEKVKEVFKELRALEKNYSEDIIKSACSKYVNKSNEKTRIEKDLANLRAEKKELEESLKELS